MVPFAPTQPISASEETRKLTEALAKRRTEVRVYPFVAIGDEAPAQKWDAYVRGHAQGSPFHLTAWLNSVETTFGHTSRHLVAFRGADIVGVLPLVEIKSMIGGRMLVSVPYAVAGGILADDRTTVESLWTEARKLGEEINANVIDLRSERAQVDGLRHLQGYAGFRKTLPPQASDVLGWLPRKARADARNARTRHRLTVEFDRKRTRDVWRLYCRNMRRLASINYPFEFFEQLVDGYGDDAIVQVVRKDSRIIGGLISFRFGQTFLPYFVGCDERFNRCNTNHFIYMTAMERAVELGCTVFDFGRTRRDNEGSYNFKRFFGFEPRPLEYQRYVYPGKTFPNLTPSNPKLQLVRQIWKHMPMSFCTAAGARLSRHLPG
jgi:FemAB-related protein (PEP-CTERM system-associated)